MRNPSEKLLDNLSRFFFLFGFITTAIFYVTPSSTSMIFRILSIGGNYGGYLFWLTSASISVDQPRPANKWYAFASIKNQHRFTAILGGIATTLAIIGIFFPIVLIVSFWLFSLSNLLWTIVTYHQKKHPAQNDPAYTAEHAQHYFRYVLLNTCASITTALTATLVFCFPVSGFLILFLGVSLNILITTGSFIYLVQSISDRPAVTETSHNTMHQHFHHNVQVQIENKVKKEPTIVYTNTFLNNLAGNRTEEEQIQVESEKKFELEAF